PARMAGRLATPAGGRPAEPGYHSRAARGIRDSGDCLGTGHPAGADERLRAGLARCAVPVRPHRVGATGRAEGIGGWSRPHHADRAAVPLTSAAVARTGPWTACGTAAVSGRTIRGGTAGHAWCVILRRAVARQRTAADAGRECAG